MLRRSRARWGCRENDIQGVKTAALLHDIGKLAVPEHILSKPGPLTPEEFQKIRAHPKVGADIISAVPFPYPVSPLILSHHERWDGKGYPAGLKGEDIPLGARILSVVDYFDALMAERPYHKAMGFDAAIGLLQQEAGKGLDPRVVEKFIELLPALQRDAPTLEQAMRRARRRKNSRTPVGRPATGLTPEPAKKNVFDDIALAHREIYALYEIAQAMGTSLGVADTMALISAKLSNLVPFSCAALFLYDEDSETLRCRFATGVDAEIIQQITVHTGEGLTGWVARNRRALVNARPSADLEAAGLLRSAHQPAVGAGVPAAVQRTLHRHAVGLSRRRRVLPRRSSAAARSRVGAGGRRHQQLDAVRADAGRLAHRSADRAAEHAIPVHAPDARAGARGAVEDRKSRCSSWTSTTSRASTTATATTSATARSAKSRACCARPSARTTSASATPATSSSSCCRDAAPKRRRASARSCSTSIDEVFFEARPGKRVALGISVGAAVFPQDGESYEALLATADSRMYQDKSRRKRPGGRERRAIRIPAIPDRTDVDIQPPRDSVALQE